MPPVQPTVEVPPAAGVEIDAPGVDVTVGVEVCFGVGDGVGVCGANTLAVSPGGIVKIDVCSNVTNLNNPKLNATASTAAMG